MKPTAVYSQVTKNIAKYLKKSYAEWWINYNQWVHVNF